MSLGVQLERFPLHFPAADNPFSSSPHIVRFWDSFLDSRGEYGAHYAIDVSAPFGTPIVAPTSGRVVRNERQDLGGNIVTLETILGTSKRSALLYFAHMLVPGTAELDDIAIPGALLGLVGATGSATGPHLHLAIWIESAPGAGDHHSHPSDAYSQLVTLSTPSGDAAHRTISDSADYAEMLLPQVLRAWRDAADHLQRKRK